MSKASRSNTSYIKMLEAVVAKRSPQTILEWGTGLSTQRMIDLLPGADIISIEHDPDWYHHWRDILSLSVDMRLSPLTTEVYPVPPQGKYDLIFIDGRYRRRCLKAALEVLSPSGVVILHDAQREWYHPAFEDYQYQVWEDYDTVGLSRQPLDDIEDHLALDYGPEIPHVVVLTHGNREDRLKQTLPTILETDSLLTLTVVANDPGKKALSYLESLRPALFGLLINQKNLGKPRAINAGWRLRDANYTVLMDDDALPLDPNWLNVLVEIARKCPIAGIVGHSVEKTDWGGEDCNGVSIQIQPGNVGGICVLIPRRIRELCGRYDEELPLYGESDGLYGWKVRQTGLHCVYHDHTHSGRYIQHLTGKDPANYRIWRDQMREDAQQIMLRLIDEYKTDRPLNQYRNYQRSISDD